MTARPPAEPSEGVDQVLAWVIGRHQARQARARVIDRLLLAMAPAAVPVVGLVMPAPDDAATDAAPETTTPPTAPNTTSTTTKGTS